MFRSLSILTVLLTVFGFVPSALADYTYSIEYAADAGTPVQSFSFSFSAPSIITAPPDSSPSFTPFIVTDGATDYSISKGLIGYNATYGISCLEFATANVNLSGNGCDFSAEVGYEPVGYFGLEFVGSLPNSVGNFHVPGFYGYVFDANGIESDIYGYDNLVQRTGTMAFAISSTQPDPVPEPSTLALVTGGLIGGLGPIRRKLQR
jgi:hypothetical protein